MRIRLFATILLCWSSLPAQGTSRGFGFLELPFSARNAALGEATVADYSSALSAHINPAILAGVQSFSISLSHQQWVQDVQSNFLFVSIPTSFVNAGISVSMTSIGGIEIRDIPGPPSGVFSSRSATIAGLVAFQYDSDLSFGASIKHAYEKIYVDEAASVLFDVGAMYRTPIEGLFGGVSIRHFGIVDQMRESRSRPPTQTSFGLSYRTALDDFEMLGVLSATSGTVTGAIRSQVGFECQYSKVVSLRLGYQSAYEVRGFSFGLGVAYGLFSFDYGSVPFTTGLGNGHLITVGIQL
ncbi:MAG: PorV/PorQ family protein [Bacteroidota bacterium]